MVPSKTMHDRFPRRSAMRARCLVLLFPLVLCGKSAPAATYRVAPDGSGDYPTIQAAIEAARPGDIVELLDGTFTGAGNRDLSYRGKAITVRSLHGNPRLCVIDCQQAARGLTLNQGEGPGSILRGVTIANGTNIAGGGGASLSGTSPTFINCVFQGNSAPTGGAIYT
jgi:predicted outer membrane repeat protein